MNTGIPNLELLLYKTQQLLSHDEEFIGAIAEMKQGKTGEYVHPDFEVECFPQIWGSTCTGFDITPDGSPAIGGSAMTKAYTTIIHETVTDCYCVFFGETPCYKVTNANQKFYEDRLKRNMASLSVAKKKY